MFHSHLIISSEPETRKKYIEAFLQKLNVHAADITTLETEESSIGIEKVRELKHTIYLSPLASPYKAVVVPGDKLTLESQHALLKLLEEPPPKTLLFVSVSIAEKLLPTILSRCHIEVLTLTKTRDATEEQIVQWQQLLRLTPFERLLTQDLYPADREGAKSELHESLAFWRTILLENYQGKKTFLYTPRHIHSILTVILETQEHVSQNGHLKLAFDHLFLRLPAGRQASP